MFDRINWTPKSKSNTLIDTKNQLADMLAKGNFTRDEWNHLLCLLNIRHFSSAECSEVMTKRTQKDSGEEGVTAKSKPMMNLVARCSQRTPAALSSTASVNVPRAQRLLQSSQQLSNNARPTPRTRVGALSRCHPGHRDTPVGPGRTPTVHRCPKGEGCGWPKHKLNTTHVVRRSTEPIRLECKHGSGAEGSKCSQDPARNAGQ